MARPKKNREQRQDRPRMTVAKAREDMQAAGQQQGSPGMLIIALIGTMAFMAFYYHYVVLPQMTQLAGGLSMPDHRPFGYSVADVTSLAAVMDGAAMGQLNWVHKTAGVVFPLVTALAVSAVGAWCLRTSRAKWITLAVSVLFVVIDIWENIAIEAALHEPVAPAVQLASTLTVLRWLLLTLLVAWMVVMLVSRFKNRKAAQSAPTR